MNKRNIIKLVNQEARELKEMINCDKDDLEEIKWALYDMFYSGYNLAWKEVNKTIVSFMIKNGKSIDNKKALKLAERLVKYG